MKKLSYLLISVFLLGLFFTKTQPVLASEGIVKLESTVGREARCFATSVFMEDQDFHILVVCRNLTYPVDSNLLYYLLWANPTSGKKPIRLGELGIGKLQTEIDNSFSSLFVTQEQVKEPKNPSSIKVMEGRVQPVEYLEELGPAPEQPQGNIENLAETEEAEEKKETKVNVPKPRGIDLSQLSGLLPLVGLIALVSFVIFLIRR